MGFAFGLVLAFNVAPLLRFLARPKALEKSAQEAARVAFFDLGIARTTGRNGLLVFVSTFEQRCVVLADVGIDVSALGKGYTDALSAMTRAVEKRDLMAFERALESLGPVLGAGMPRTAGDVNELADEVR